jgi:hypothetical protein
MTSGSVRTAFRAGVDWGWLGKDAADFRWRVLGVAAVAHQELAVYPSLAGAREVDQVSGVNALVSAGPQMLSELFGGHDPQLADGGVPGTGDHVGDAVGDVLGSEYLGLFVEGVDHLVADLGGVVRAQFGRHATGLDEADAHVPLGEFLAQGLGESAHAELGEAVDAVAVPGDAAGDRADVDDVGDPARAMLGGLQQVG